MIWLIVVIVHWLWNFQIFKFRAYDRAAIKFRGLDADINFNLVEYEEDMNQVCKTKRPFD